MLQSGAVDLVAICDVDAARLDATGERFGIARRYSDMAEMIRASRAVRLDIRSWMWWAVGPSTQSCMPSCLVSDFKKEERVCARLKGTTLLEHRSSDQNA